MANERYAVPFQAFITNGAVITSDVTGRVAVAGNTTLTLSTTGGAGTFTITLGSGCTGTITSGSATITGSPLALVAGVNTVTSNGAGTCTLNLVLGTAALWSSVNTWSASSGGVSGASVPASTNPAIQDANSFTAASQVLTADAGATCLDINWTGATNNPRMTFAAFFALYGSVTTIAAMSFTGGFAFLCNGTTCNVTTNGLNWSSTGLYLRGSTMNIMDTFTGTGLVALDTTGTFNTNNNTMTIGAWYFQGSSARTCNWGSSTINCSSFNATTVTGLTISANTAIINVTGTGVGDLNNANYNGATFNFNGTAHTISGSPTGILTFRRTGTATATDSVTFTSGQTITCTNFALIGNSSTNRLLAKSTTPGVPATITATYTAFSNVDFRGITLTNAYDQATNLCTNASFTTDLTGWAASGSLSAARDTSVYSSSPASMRLHTAGGNYTAYTFQLPIYKAYQGISLTWSASTRAESTNVSDQGIRIYDGVSGSTSGVLAKDSAWHTTSVSRTISTSATVVWGDMLLSTGSYNAGDVSYLDNCSLTITGTIRNFGGNTGITGFTGISPLLAKLIALELIYEDIRGHYAPVKLRR